MPAGTREAISIRQAKVLCFSFDWCLSFRFRLHGYRTGNYAALQLCLSQLQPALQHAGFGN